MTLEQFFRENRKAAVAFSGGTDSAFLLWAAKKYGCEVRAYYVKTAFQPAFELQDARRLAGELDVPMTELPVEILEVPEAADNGQERCYYCKKALFTRLREAAKQDGFSLLLDGTNASDDAGDRPGMRALEELRVRSPLRECGMTKDEVRKSSKEAGLFTWDPYRHQDLHGGSEKSGKSRRSPCGTWLFGFPGALVWRSGQDPGDGTADGIAAPGTGKGVRGIEACVFRGAAGSYSPAGVKIGIKIAGLKRRDVYG